MRLVFFIGAASLALVCVQLAGEPEALHEWPAVGGNRAQTRYSPLKQITRDNVTQLRLAWQFDSGDEYENSEIQCNPIVVGGVLYATTPRLRVVALNASTGKLIWDFDARRGREVKGKQRNRGLVYWTDGKQGRLFVGIDVYLYALDAQTGKPVAGFGNEGRIDLREGLGRPPEQLRIQATSPGVIYKDLLIQGTLVPESLPSAPGHVRAFDVRTGKTRWIFHTIPQPGEFGYDTWPKDAHTYSGGANSWPGVTLDAERSTVFVPTGSASFDFYGANRAGNNLFANCLLALDAATGKRKWHFQFVKHDVWDRDLPSAPTLVRVKRNGKMIDAVAQITKSGHVWVFDRDTGESLFPFREVKVPASDVGDEKLATTQVLPLAPAPFARQELTADLLTSRTPAARQAVLERFRTVRSGPQFTPPSREGTIIFPGFDGGGEWGGASWDPETGLFYVNSNEMAWILRMVPRQAARGRETGQSLYARNCAGCHRADMNGTPPEFPALTNLTGRSREQLEAVVRKGAGRMPGFGHLGNAAIDAVLAYVIKGENLPVSGPEHVEGKAAAAPGMEFGIDGYNKFLDPDGYPAVEPPWGTLNAIDLNTGEYRWRIPFGEFPALAAQGIRNTGSENYGGGVVTAGGLFFIAATNHDRKLRAFDKLTGKLLWETELPASGNATPAVYEVGGRQFIAIAAGGGKSGAKSGGSYVAFALPEGKKR